MRPGGWFFVRIGRLKEACLKVSMRRGRREVGNENENVRDLQESGIDSTRCQCMYPVFYDLVRT